MRPELAALVVHDLKNALGALEAELLDLTLAPTATATATPRSSPDAAARAHRHCSELRQRFVMFLSIYGASGPMLAQAHDESPLDLLRSLAHDSAGNEAGLAVTVKIEMLPSAEPTAAVPPYWYFDRHLVRMAMQAALHNALRFARREVVLSACRQGEHLVFSVDDDGCGLGAVDASAQAGHATGLGTELCRAVALAHQHEGRCGHIVLADRAQGGARFELWLP